MGQNYHQLQKMRPAAAVRFAHPRVYERMCVRECVSVCLCMFSLFLLCFLVCVNQSINIVFSVCSHRGDIRQKQKTKTIVIIYNNFCHRTMDNRFGSISNNISIIQNISYLVVSI